MWILAVKSVITMLQTLETPMAGVEQVTRGNIYSSLGKVNQIYIYGWMGSCCNRKIKLGGEEREMKEGI